jgi:hypothetical protein
VGVVEFQAVGEFFYNVGHLLGVEIILLGFNFAPSDINALFFVKATVDVFESAFAYVLTVAAVAACVCVGKGEVEGEAGRSMTGRGREEMVICGVN